MDYIIIATLSIIGLCVMIPITIMDILAWMSDRR